MFQLLTRFFLVIEPCLVVLSHSHGQGRRCLRAGLLFTRHCFRRSFGSPNLHQISRLFGSVVGDAARVRARPGCCKDGCSRYRTSGSRRFGHGCPALESSAQVRESPETGAQERGNRPLLWKPLSDGATAHHHVASELERLKTMAICGSRMNERPAPASSALRSLFA